MTSEFKNILITGTAGFIGFHLANRLLSTGCRVLGVDNLNDYYDVNLKKDRLAILEKNPGFSGCPAYKTRRAGDFSALPQGEDHCKAFVAGLH